MPKSLIGTATWDNRVAIHVLPKTEAVVDTVFIRRRDALASSALAAFLAMICPASAPADATQQHLYLRSR